MTYVEQSRWILAIFLDLVRSACIQSDGRFSGSLFASIWLALVNVRTIVLRPSKKQSVLRQAGTVKDSWIQRPEFRQTRGGFDSRRLRRNIHAQIILNVSGFANLLHFGALYFLNLASSAPDPVCEVTGLRPFGNALQIEGDCRSSID